MYLEKIIFIISCLAPYSYSKITVNPLNDYRFYTLDENETTALKQKAIYSYNNAIENDYFIIKFDSTFNTSDQAFEMLNIFNEAKIIIDSFGYKQNYSIEHGNKYLIELCPNTNEDDSNVIAATTKIANYGNKREDIIVFYNLTNINQDIKETIYHEYFHSIQDNYNYFYNKDNTKRFVEACAQWAMYKFNNDTHSNNYRFLTYMNKDYQNSVYKTNGYAELLFPFTLEKLFDENIIRKIYEYMSVLPAEQTFSSLKNVINEVIKKEYNSNDTFDTVFKNIASSIISIKNNYPNYSITYNDIIFWAYNKTQSISPTFQSKYSVNSYANNYYKISLPTDVNYHDLNIIIDTNYQNSFFQLYIIDSSNNNYIIPINKINNKYTYNLIGLSKTIKRVYLITTNCEDSTASFDLKLNYTNHNFSNHYCTLCGEYLDDHSYTSKYSYLNKTSHYAFCDCGEKILTSHVIESGSSAIKKTCLYCGATGVFDITKE